MPHRSFFTKELGVFRYFRMPQECFDVMCLKIKQIVCTATFKREKFHSTLIMMRDINRLNIAHTHSKYKWTNSWADQTPNYIGVSYWWFIPCSCGYFGFQLFKCLQWFCLVIAFWISGNIFVDVNREKYCKVEGKMQEVAWEFSETTHDFFDGCMRIIDGWLMRVTRHIAGEGNFIQQKGYSKRNKTK